MPYKNQQVRKEYVKRYNNSYYVLHREHLLAYRKGRREKDRENYKNWKLRQEEKKRMEKIKLGTVYTPKKNIYGF